MSRTERLLQLLQSLRRHRRPVTAAALAAEFQVSVRSIYRDLQTLRAEGAVIEGAAGAGYLLRPGFLLPPLMFTEEEIEAVVLGLRLTAEHGDAALLRAAVEVAAKLRAVLPSELRDLCDDTALLAGPARERPADAVELREVRQAIRGQRKGRIAYVDQKGAATTRVIWPFAVGFFARARVVIALCEARQDFRCFRADRITHWETLSERYPRSRAALLKQWREREGIPAQLPD